MNFRLRLHNPDLFIGNPGGLVLEVTRGDMTHSFGLDREDIAALSALTFAYNAGEQLPIVTGSGS